MAQNKSKQYDDTSITSLKGADRVRLRPSVIFGSNDLSGCAHAVFEIISNGIDEAREGHGSEILVTVFRDGSFQVEDFGRGCPVDWNEKEQRYNWELVFCELYAGGKYANAEGEGYSYSLGLNGLGACATQYASRYMDVTVYRNGKKYSLHFERGENIGGLTSEDYKGRRSGTTIRWKPDLDVFTEIDVPVSWFEDTMSRQAVSNANVRLRLLVEQEGGGFSEKDYLYPNGIVDYVAGLIGDDEQTQQGLPTPPHYIECARRGRDREDKPDYNLKISAVFAFSNTTQITEYYHNSSWLEHGGSPEKAAKSAFVSAFDALLKKLNKYAKNESGITWVDVCDCLILVTNCFSTQTSYENQTKKSINNKFIQESMRDFFKEQLEIWAIENPKDAQSAAEQILINKRSRENAEKARLNIKKKLIGSLDIANRVQKFVDCRTKDKAVRELYIVEGDSALGACKLSRDAEFQGIIPVRGKILNCLKAGYERIFASEIITDLLRVLGCGVEIRNKHTRDLSEFSIDALRWNKVIICTDADVDGFQIRTLILTMLYRLVPTLIEKGFVYIAESPLFEITQGEKTYFAYSEREKAETVKNFGGKKHNVQRSKGLGENDPDMMWLTTMNPETRRLIRVMPAEAAAVSDMFDLLLGDNLAGRKEHIAVNGHLFLDTADIS